MPEYLVSAQANIVVKGTVHFRVEADSPEEAAAHVEQADVNSLEIMDVDVVPIDVQYIEEGSLDELEAQEER